MQIDPRLNDIDDCLYRVATKAIIFQDDKILMVKEIPEMWWGFPGGGVDHGETIESSLVRELEEELGVPAKDVESDFKIAHCSIGTVVEHIPRMNLFYRVSIPKDLVKKTAHVETWGWFTKNEFLKLNLSPSYKDKAKLAAVIFSK